MTTVEPKLEAPESLHSLDPTQIGRDVTGTKKWILEKIQLAKTSRTTYCPSELLFHLKEQGLVDVTVDELNFGDSVRTSLKIHHPRSALLSQQALSELNYGYCYYDKFHKCPDNTGHEKDILVNGEELKEKFQENLPTLTHVWFEDLKEGRTPDTGPDHRDITIDYIGALFELEKDPATIHDLLSSFLTTFLTILADKSFELRKPSMT